MKIKNCYMIKENANIRKLLIEIQGKTETSIGTNFYEITIRKKSNDSYEFIKADVLKKPFEHFQELAMQGKIKKVSVSSEKLIHLITNLLNYNIINYDDNYKEFDYSKMNDFYKKNGINIGHSKKLSSLNKRDK